MVHPKNGHMCTLPHVYKSIEDDSNTDHICAHHMQQHNDANWDKHICVFKHKRRWLPFLAFSFLIAHKVMSVYHSLSLKDLCLVRPCYLLAIQ